MLALRLVMVTVSGVWASSAVWLTLLGADVFSEDALPLYAEQAMRLRAITPARVRETIFFMFMFTCSFSEKY